MGSINRALKEITEKIRVRGAMPGNKGRYDCSFSHDVTELDGLDNLQHPEGIIRQSQDETARIYGVHSARYLVNGSSSGNLTMIFSFFHEGDRVLVERNCHKSIYSGIILRKLRPVFLYPEKNSDGLLYPVRPEQVKKALEEDDGIKGVILTSPSYSGIASELEKIYKITKEHKIPLLIDGAHGAHLRGIKGYEDYYRSCDAMVVSVHKTMNALNQASVLLNNREDMENRILEYSDMFQTTSPSYIIMESIELSCEDLDKGVFTDTRSIDTIRQKEYRNLRILDEAGSRLDPWKINIIGDGKKITEGLLKRGIYPEMNNDRSVLLMLSPYNTEEEFEILRKSLDEIDNELDNTSYDQDHTSYDQDHTSYDQDVIPEIHTGAPERVLEIHEAYERETESIELMKAEGCISHSMVIPYPPGIPILVPGERIDRKTLDVLKKITDEGRMILGVSDGSIEIVKGER